jgi:glucosamine--fructose-6-phosphate aminotransferase (isomerizing)
MTLHDEIFEQAACLRSLLRAQRPQAEAIAAAIQRREVQYAFLAARGTSDNAGRYANLWGVTPAGGAGHSLHSYRQPPCLKGRLVGISRPDSRNRQRWKNKRQIAYAG